jgi:hypothetical protein
VRQDNYLMLKVFIIAETSSQDLEFLKVVKEGKLAK